MKNSKLYLLALILLISACAKKSDSQDKAATNTAAISSAITDETNAQNIEPKRFKRVMMFPGGGLQTALFLGMLEGTEQAGMAPDVIVGSCGGSLAAALAQAFPNSQIRHDFVKSEEYHQAMLAAEVDNKSMLRALYKVMGMINRRIGLVNSLPDIFSGTVMKVPEDLKTTRLNLDFAQSPSNIKTVILASKSFYDPAHVGLMREDGQKYFQEVFFTDPSTAKLLKDLQSGVAVDNPDSYIDVATEASSDQLLVTAARASITDPYYINPIKINGYYYFTGAMDLYPIEVARALGDEIIAPFMPGFDTLVEQNAFGSVYGYSNNSRLRKYHSSSDVAHWVDFSDAEVSIYKTSGFNPKMDILSLSIKSGVPKDLAEYQRKVDGLWEFGRKRALEAMSMKSSSQEHIRMMRCENTFPGSKGCPDNSNPLQQVSGP